MSLEWYQTLFFERNFSVALLQLTQVIESVELVSALLLTGDSEVSSGSTDPGSCIPLRLEDIFPLRVVLSSGIVVRCELG